jgi:hypothetical protein
VVEPYFQQPFAWETWQVGSNDLPSGCGGGKSDFLSYTISGISIPEAEADESMSGYTWGVLKDHRCATRANLFVCRELTRKMKERKRTSRGETPGTFWQLDWKERSAYMWSVLTGLSL